MACPGAAHAVAGRLDRGARPHSTAEANWFGQGNAGPLRLAVGCLVGHVVIGEAEFFSLSQIGGRAGGVAKLAVDQAAYSVGSPASWVNDQSTIEILHVY